MSPPTPGPLARMMIGMVRWYQQSLSPRKPAPTCRFTPTCSEYAAQALARYGVWRGGGLALWRILRCHPWGGSGADPVPELSRRRHFPRDP